MEEATLRLVLLGEQATGKSSLLVALYGALVNRRAGDLRIVRTTDTVEFLSRGLEAFGRHESVRRTTVDSNDRLLVELARADGDSVVTLDLPDRSGELLKHMLDTRVWDPELHRQIAAAAGALLFLRPDPPAAAEERDAALWPDEQDGPAANGQPQPWTPAQMPIDARMVDLLQELLEERTGPFPIAVIISAWDRVSAAAPSPQAWLARHVPLLEQFLASNARQLPHAIYGVSAQGGEFDHPPDGLIADDPWDRAYLVGPDGLRGTLEEPIVWLLDAAGR